MHWIWFALAWGAEPLTLDAAVERALRGNLELASQRHENRIAELGLEDARAGFDPQLSASARTSGSRDAPSNAQVSGAAVTTTSRSWSAGLSTALPTGGSASVGLDETLTSTTDANAIFPDFTYDNLGVSVVQPLLRGAFQGELQSLRDAHLALLEQEIQWRQQVEQLTLDVTNAYWGLVSARQGRQLAERAVELANEQLSQTEERRAAGFAGSGDVLQVQVTLGQAKRSLVEARASEQAAEATLARVLGMPVDEGSDLDPVDLPSFPETSPSREALLESARNGNTTYLLAEITHERSVRAARRAKNAALPDLTVDGSAGWASGARNPARSRSDLVGNPSPSWGVGVSLGLPLIMRDSRAQYGIAKLREEQAELALKAAEQDLVLSVDGALRDVVRDRAALEVAQQTLEHAQKSLEAQRELLSEGRGSTAQVVDALESLRAAEVSKLMAEIACQSSLQRAVQVSGRLLE